MDTDNITKKWLANELTPQEAEAFKALDDAPFYEKIVSDASLFKASEISTMPDFETFKERLGTVDDTPVRRLSWIQPMLRIASVAILAFGLYYFLIYTATTEVQTLAAQKTMIELPDSSQVTLNALSEIAYKENQWDQNREINLKGEAFFDVAKGAKFNVVTAQGTVSVLGTEFTVKQRGDFFEVVCFEGTVKVVFDETTTILKAGDDFKSVQQQTENGKHRFSAPQWIDNKSYFQRIPLSEVFAELERQYDVSVAVDGIDVAQLFTGGFAHTNLENALAAITEPLEMEYKVVNSQKISVSLRKK